MDNEPSTPAYAAPDQGRPATVNSYSERVVGLAAMLSALLCAGLALLLMPPGYGGADDFHYLRAAERWVNEGAHAGTDHWQTRLPYILSLALVLRLPVPPDPSLYVVNILGFCGVVVSLTTVAYRAFGTQPAAWTAFVACITPFFIRRATVLYPEMMEAGLVVTSLALAWLGVFYEGKKFRVLVVSGALAGIAFTVRQTALSIPLAFCGWLIVHFRGDLRRIMMTVVPYGAGAFFILITEALFYFVITGDPLWRLKVDLGHVMVPTPKMDGYIFDGGLPLFNPELAARWRVPGFLDAHWTIDGLVRVFVDPALLPLVGCSILGICLGLSKERDERARSVFVLACLALLFQWILNSFVMMLAPNVRYFMNAIAVLSIPAAYFLVSLPLFVRVCAAAAILLHMPMVIAVQPFYASVGAQIGKVREWTTNGQQHYLAGDFVERTLLLRIDDPALRAKLPIGEPGVGQTMITNIMPDLRLSENLCEGGEPKWVLVDTLVPRTGAGLLIRRIGAEHLLGEKIVTYIDGSSYRAYLIRRAC